MSLLYSIKEVQKFQEGGAVLKKEDPIHVLPADVPDPEILEAEVGLKKAKEKAKVKKLQQMMISYGFLSGEDDQKIDGVLGEQTLAALEKIRSTQKTLGVKADGIIGKNTMAAADKSGVNLREVSLLLGAGTKSGEKAKMDAAEEYAKAQEEAAILAIGSYKHGGLFYK